jgi:NADH-quinone oxidoreductase subunit M
MFSGGFFVILCLDSTQSVEGLLGGTFLMVGHGLVSSLLFFLIGFLYDRYGTRLLIYYGGIIKTMPLFTFFFLIASLGNLGLPGTSNFIGEFLIFIGVLAKNKILFLFALCSVVLTSIYSLCATVIL